MDQRKQGKKYEVDCTKSAMTREKIEHLEDLGFKWSVKEDNDVVWNRRFEELKKYAGEHNGQLPRIQESKLGKWASHQRSNPEMRAAHTAERKAKLRSISSSFHY